MARKVIRITESELQETIKDAISSVITEIGYRSAALAHGANYNAAQAKAKLKDKSSLEKMNKSSQTRLPSLTLAIQDNMPNLVLHFIETDKSRMSYEVRFKFQDVKYLDTERMVLGGFVSLMGEDYSIGSIEYNFANQSFYRVRFLANGSIRRIYKLEQDDDYNDSFNQFLTFITHFMYSEEDYEHNIDINGPTPSKSH